MDLSIIVPCYNAAHTLPELIESIAKQKWEKEWEVLFVDNGSTDNTVDIINNYIKSYDNMYLILAQDKRGAGYARNIGVTKAKGTSVAFLDADDLPGEDWVARIGNSLFKYDFVASRWDIEKLNNEVIQKARKNQQVERIQDYTYPEFLPHSGGCGLGVKKHIFHKVNGFSEEFKLLEDTDFCFKVQLKGYNIQFVSDAIVHVRFRDSFISSCRQGYYYGMYNVLLYKKYKNNGMAKLTLKEGIHGWIKLIKQYKQIVATKSSRMKWFRQYFWRVGRIAGCVKYRVVAI